MRNLLTRTLLAVLLIASSSLFAIAQSSPVTIKGSVKFSDDPLSAVGVRVALNIADTAKLTQRGRVILTSATGSFQFTTDEEKIDLTFSHVGYRTITVKINRIEGQSVLNMGEVLMHTAAKSVESVVVTGTVAMARVDGDTIIYNAAAFKTNPDATAEDLLKKLPGVTTDDNGNIEAQGEAITKVLVNGKEYFEDDPTLALKTLPVDAVESMKLYDDQTDDAKFSGFDDGERVKTIDIITKAGVMNSSFGKAYAGYGTDSRYAVGAGINTFTDLHRYTVVGQVNNVNNQGFSLNDISGNTRFGGSRGSGVSGFTTSNSNGIMESYMLSTNYNGEFNNNMKVSAAYSYSGANSDNWSKRDQEYLTEEERQYYSYSENRGFGNNHTLSARMQWQPTDIDRITATLRAYYSNNFGTSLSQTTTSYLSSDEDLATIISNNIYSNSDYETKLDRFSASGDFYWLHRLGKAGRTFSIGANLSGNRDIGDRTQYSDTYTTSSLSDFTVDTVMSTIDQIGSLNSSGFTLGGSATYTEPLSSNSRLSLNYKINYNRTFSDQQGLNYDQAVLDYILQDTSSTNYMNSNYTTQNVGLAYSYSQGRDFRVNASLSYQNSMQNNYETTLSPDSPFVNNYTFQALIPSLRVNYIPGEGHNLSLEYRGSSNFPTVSQLQDVLDNTEPLSVSIGNPDLKQTYSHRVSFRYSMADVYRNLNFGFYANATFANDYISNEEYFLTKDTIINGTTVVSGAKLTVPTNLQGYMNASVTSNFGFPLNFISSNMNLSAYYRYTRTPSKSDGLEYLTVSDRIGGMVSLTSNISESVDFTVRYSPGLSLSSASSSFDRYFSHNLSANANIYIGENVFVNGDVSWRNTYGTLESYNQHYIMLNAAIGVKFLKNRQAELKFSVYDALGQNQSYSQSTQPTYIQISESQILQRYYMLSFMFKIDTRKNKGSDSRRGDSGRGERGGGEGGDGGGGGRGGSGGGGGGGGGR